MASIDRYPTTNGVRWRARWRTPDGGSRSKVFPRRVDAERFLIQLEQAKLRGAYVDPAAGRVLLSEYGEKWRVNQVQHRPSTRARVEGDLRKHLYPAHSRPGAGRRRVRHGRSSALQETCLLDLEASAEQEVPCPQCE
jgi:hypothetical protein